MFVACNGDNTFHSGTNLSRSQMIQVSDTVIHGDEVAQRSNQEQSEALPVGQSQQGPEGIEENTSEGLNNPPPAAAAGPQLRLLSGAEYGNTVADLFGKETTVRFDHADTSAGFENGAGSTLSPSLFLKFLSQAQSLAERLVSDGQAMEAVCANGVNGTSQCLKAWLQEFSAQAFRRKLTAEELQKLEEFFDKQIALRQGDKVLALQDTLVRLAIAPEFLFRVERVDNSGNTLSMESHATLISYTLTGSMPDKALLESALSRQLSSNEALRHIDRLLSTDQAKNWISQFVKQWLGIASVDLLRSAPQGFPKLPSHAAGAAMADEVDLFIKEVIFNRKGTLHDLLLTKISWVNRHNAPLYGLNSGSEALQMVSMDNHSRGGLLTLAGVMTLLASETDPAVDNPISRAMMIKERLLCESVGLPSGVDTATAISTASQGQDLSVLTTRERFEQIMEQDQSCSSCHASFMPFGYLFGEFDGLGRQVTEFQGRAVDTSVVATLRSYGPRHYDNVLPFLEDLARSPEAHLCFAKRLASFVTGRLEGPAQSYLTFKVTETSQEATLPILDVLRNLLTSQELLSRKGDGK